MTSPMFNQFTSGLLHTVLHLIIYNIKRTFELVFHIGIFKPEKAGKIYFPSDCFGNG